MTAWKSETTGSRYCFFNDLPGPKLFNLPNHAAKNADPFMNLLCCQAGIAQNESCQSLVLCRRGFGKQRRERLGERSDINDTSIHVHRLQRVDGTLAIAKLAAVIVLNNPSALSTRSTQQFEATSDRKHRPHGKLVRRCDKGQAHAIIFGQGAGIQSRYVYGYWTELPASAGATHG